MRFPFYSIQTPFRRNSVFARLSLVLFSFVVLVCGTAATAEEQEQLYFFEIPSLKLEDALNRVAKQTKYQLLFSVDLVEPLQSRAVVGEYTISRP